MVWHLFFSVYILIFIAELPDKTAFATLLMATRGRPFAIFVGVAAAFLVQTTVAAIFGGVLSLAPEKWVHLSAGILFLGFAAHTWLHKGDAENTRSENTENAPRTFWKSAWKSFLVIFVAEWGDLTQIATASLIAKYHEERATVFVAALLALWTVTAIAVILGKKAAELINPRLLKTMSAVLFCGIGAYFVITWWLQ